MRKTICVCDMCQEERDDLIRYIVPFPTKITAYGGRKGSPKMIIMDDEISQKEIDLCPKCAWEIYNCFQTYLEENKDETRISELEENEY